MQTAEIIAREENLALRSAPPAGQKKEIDLTATCQNSRLCEKTLMAI
jgi:hypothetical protein